MKRLGLIILATALALSVALPAGAAGKASKLFLPELTPSTISGASTPLTLKITNNSPSQTLGSSKWVAPAGITLNSIAASGAFTTCPVQNGTPSAPKDGTRCGVITGGTVLWLFNLSLAANGGSFTGTLTVTPTAGCGTVTWSQIFSKQSNDFSGTGNDFTPTSYPQTTVFSGCHLVWTTSPADAFPDQTITGTAFTPSSNNFVKVAVENNSNQVVTGFTGTISVALGLNTTSATLDGTASQQAVNGVSSFTDLSITELGTYSLVASTTGMASVDSRGGDPENTFSIVQNGAVCTGPNCTLSAGSSTSDTRGSVLAPKSVNGNSIWIAFNIQTDPGFDCKDYTEPGSEPMTFEYDGAGAKIVKYVIGFSVVHEDPSNSNQPYLMCLSSTLSFTPRPGYALNTQVIDGVTWYSAVIPDCDRNKNPSNMPCQAGTNRSTGDGSVELTAQVPEHDAARFR